MVLHTQWASADGCHHTWAHNPSGTLPRGSTTMALMTLSPRARVRWSPIGTEALDGIAVHHPHARPSTGTYTNARSVLRCAAPRAHACTSAEGSTRSFSMNRYAASVLSANRTPAPCHPDGVPSPSPSAPLALQSGVSQVHRAQLGPRPRLAALRRHEAADPQNSHRIPEFLKSDRCSEPSLPDARSP